MQNYWIERDVNKRDGWEYLSPDFRIKHYDSEDLNGLNCPLCDHLGEVLSSKAYNIVKGILCPRCLKRFKPDA
jgi:hypothetical protein